jgi:hypothetical protein
MKRPQLASATRIWQPEQQRDTTPLVLSRRMNLTITLYLLFLTVVSLVVWRMWMKGEISVGSLRTPGERVRQRWVILGAVNFVAFLAHLLVDRGCAFPAGGRLVGGAYLVTEHGQDVAFAPAAYFFSYLHGLFFVAFHLVCMIGIWQSRQTRQSSKDVDGKRPILK